VTERREPSAPAEVARPGALTGTELARVRDLLDTLPAAPAVRPRPRPIRWGMDHELTRVADPPLPAKGTFDYECMVAQERKTKEAAAARRAEEDRLRREAEAAESERAAAYEANRENRERAIVEDEHLDPEFARVECQIASLQAEHRALVGRRKELLEVIQRHARRR
jgi:hypothetical protein